MSEEATEAIESVAAALRALGMGNGPTARGAIEGLTVALVGGDPWKETSLAGALCKIADGLHDIADAIREHGGKP